MKNKHRLQKKEDFAFLFRHGENIDSRLFRIIFKKNNIGHGRFAFITPRTMDKRSVIRNKLRRRAREWIRNNSDLYKKSMDVAIIFKKESVLISRNVFYEELEKKIKEITN